MSWTKLQVINRCPAVHKSCSKNLQRREDAEGKREKEREGGEEGREEGRKGGREGEREGGRMRGKKGREGKGRGGGGRERKRVSVLALLLRVLAVMGKYHKLTQRVSVLLAVPFCSATDKREGKHTIEL